MTSVKFTNKVVSTFHLQKGNRTREYALFKPSHSLISNDYSKSKISLDDYLQKKNTEDHIKKFNGGILIKDMDRKVNVSENEKNMDEKKDEHDMFDVHEEDTAILSLKSFPSTSTLSLEEDTRNLFPRTLFTSYWSKNLPDRVESFCDKPFPLRDSLVRNCDSATDLSKDDKPNSISQFDEKKRRFIFGITTSTDHTYFRKKDITHTSSDIILERYGIPRAPVRKAESTSVLLRNNNRRNNSSRNVRFNPRIDVVEYQAVSQFYAKDDWSKYYV